jgi:hypothetical protein
VSFRLGGKFTGRGQPPRRGILVCSFDRALDIKSYDIKTRGENRSLHHSMKDIGDPLAPKARSSPMRLQGARIALRLGLFALSFLVPNMSPAQASIMLWGTVLDSAGRPARKPAAGDKAAGYGRPSRPRHDRYPKPASFQRRRPAARSSADAFREVRGAVHPPCLWPVPGPSCRKG